MFPAVSVTPLAVELLLFQMPDTTTMRLPAITGLGSDPEAAGARCMGAAFARRRAGIRQPMRRPRSVRPPAAGRLSTSSKA